MEPKKDGEEFKGIHIQWTQNSTWGSLHTSLEQSILRLQQMLDNVDEDEDYLSRAQHEASSDFDEEFNEQEMDTFFDMIHYEIVDSKVKGDVHPEVHNMIMNAYYKHKE